MTTIDQMMHALDRLAEQRRKTPCATHDPELWFSDSPTEKAWAASLCHGCPLLDQCHEVAEEIHASHGVWARPRPVRRQAEAGSGMSPWWKFWEFMWRLEEARMLPPRDDATDETQTPESPSPDKRKRGAA